jgi:putative DNA primase/helicase
VRNGVIDLRTDRFREASRADYITKQCNAVFDEMATCPLWEKFLLDTTQGNHELIAYLAHCAGISLTGHTKEHLFFIVVGPGGTGKSTFFETIKYVWGDYAIGIDPNSIAASMKAEGGRARPDIARLPGVRLAFANETRKGLQLDAGLIKALTGGDTVQARHLYQAEFDFKPTHKLWLRTNEEPQFDGADTGMQRRVKKIPFVNEVKKTKPEDPNLPEKLCGEAAGILNWAIRGLLSYQKYGLAEPAIITTETAEYIKSLDILAQFIDEECEIGVFIGAERLLAVIRKSANFAICHSPNYLVISSNYKPYNFSVIVRRFLAFLLQNIGESRVQTPDNFPKGGYFMQDGGNHYVI